MPRLTLNPNECSSFSKRLQQIYNNINDRVPYTETGRPVIGISTNYTDRGSCVAFAYTQAVERAGGIPFLIPQTTSVDLLEDTIQRIDALLLTGGGDPHPHYFDQEPSRSLGEVQQVRDESDLTLLALALQYNLPILGICRGMQMINVALGGTLYQDIYSDHPNKAHLIGHNPPIDTTQIAHYVTIIPEKRSGVLGQILDRIGSDGRVGVNSVHHQAVGQLSTGVSVVALSVDNVVEAIELYPEKPAIGVQWHPERIEEHAPLFDHLLGEAVLYRKAKRIHSHAPIIVDSHTDTPMLFCNGPLDLSHRSNALVDFVKMRQGKIDAVFMATYIPQGDCSPSGYESARSLMLQKREEIELLADRYKDHCLLASTYSEIIGAKAQRKAILIPALENAYPLGEDLSRLDELKAQGIAYITICHNGDNQFCDSARRSSNTHNGLSALGKGLIDSMQRLGIMIDVSHASYKTVEDILACTEVPIIASHSSAYTICHHERNLPDELIQKIAKRGGVVQVCMYAGFVSADEEQASLYDLVDHIDHIVRIAGIDSVGIGSDFDGDGSLVGCRGSNDLIRITIELLRRGYSTEAIEKIWGGNLLRVKKEVEAFALRLR